MSDPSLPSGSQAYTVPRTRRGWSALLLALAMHGILAIMLIFGIRWQSHKPDTVEAELWSAVPQYAAPAPAPTPPAPAPAPDIKAIAPLKMDEPAVLTPPDLAIKELAPLKKPKPPQPPAPEPKPVVKPERPPAKPEVKAPPTAPSDLALLTAQAGKPANGTAATTAGPRGLDSYTAKIRTKIRSNMRFPPPPGVTGNPLAKVRIEQLPTGEVVSATLQSSSGLPAFDAAVIRAVEASSPLPKDDQGNVAREFTLDYKLFDEN